MGFPSTVSVQDLKTFLDSGVPFCLIDVRQDWEFQLCHIKGSLHLPLDQLTQKLKKIPTDVPLFTLCHHGIRSGQAAAFLKNAGFKDVCNIKGGIDAWAKQIDPSLTTY